MLRSPWGRSPAAFTYRREEITALEEVSTELSKAHQATQTALKCEAPAAPDFLCSTRLQKREDAGRCRRPNAGSPAQAAPVPRLSPPADGKHGASAGKAHPGRHLCDHRCCVGAGEPQLGPGLHGRAPQSSCSIVSYRRHANPPKCVFSLSCFSWALPKQVVDPLSSSPHCNLQYRPAKHIFNLQPSLLQ